MKRLTEETKKALMQGYTFEDFRLEYLRIMLHSWNGKIYRDTIYVGSKKIKLNEDEIEFFKKPYKEFILSKISSPFKCYNEEKHYYREINGKEDINMFLYKEANFVTMWFGGGGISADYTYDEVKDKIEII